MTYTKLKNIYDTLNNHPSLSSTELNIGWKLEDISYPCINIIQAGGSEVGRFGYQSGNDIQERFTIQLDIYSRKSMMEAYQIYDTLNDIMISSGYEKTSDSDMFDGELNTHRKVTRWSINTID